MTSTYDDGGRSGQIEVLGVQRRRQWTPEEKVRILEETHLPGHSVSLVARRKRRRHNSRVAVDVCNTRWCSDGLEIACDNGAKVRVAFALDCCDREAMGYVATTVVISAADVRDLITLSVEHRFGQVNALADPIEWLTDNGSCYTAHDTRRFARKIGLVPCTTLAESPQSNGMAEAFVRTLKRDYARVNPKPDARAVIEQLPSWFAHYNTVYPHRAFGYRSPREFIAHSTQEDLSGLYGATTLT